MTRLNNDLISRKALLEAMQQVLNKENPNHAHIFSVIANAPTVEQDSEPVAKVCESLKEQDYCVDVRAGAEAIRALIERGIR